jgi:hypothetical protein
LPVSEQRSVAICPTLCHNANLSTARLKGCRGGGDLLVKKRDDFNLCAKEQPAQSSLCFAASCLR